MEAVIFSGVQAAGKSSFYQTRFVDTHVRINLDMLRTRRREGLLLQACLEAFQPLVVDNTNLTADQRAIYVSLAQVAGFRVVAYSFLVNLDVALARNAVRLRRRPVPEKAIWASMGRWEPPRLEEGFSAIWSVRAEGGDFDVRLIAGVDCQK